MSEAIHSLSKDHKEKFWGSGPWVEEPDEEEFEFEGLKCKILRKAIPSDFLSKEFMKDYDRLSAENPNDQIVTNFSPFGGYLCGYVRLPEGHPWMLEKDIRADVHGGITLNEQTVDGRWIGFDCGHVADVIPSMEALERKALIDESMMWFKKREAFKQEILEQCPDFPFFNKVYRNFTYVKCQVIDLAHQVKDAIAPSGSPQQSDLGQQKG